MGKPAAGDADHDKHIADDLVGRQRRAMTEAPSALRAAPPLFLNDRQLREIVAPHIGLDRFRSILKALEAKGFPRANAQFGGRYYPAVRIWLDASNGLGKTVTVGMAEDGEENWDAPKKRRAGHKMADAH